MNLDERVALLEKRVELLEMRLGKAENGDNGRRQALTAEVVPKPSEAHDEAIDRMMADGQMDREFMPGHTGGEGPTPDGRMSNGLTPESLIRARNLPRAGDGGGTKKQTKGGQINEALFGKYIVGALASFLVFIAAVSLVALVWDRMSSGGKLTLLTMAGFSMTGIGLVRIRKHKNPISAIIMGTGAGLLFISILAANMAFDLIASQAAFLFAGVWALAFIFLYKYTQMFFTTVIAYIGSLIAVILGLSLIESQTDFIVVLVFAVCIGTALVMTARRWLSKIKQLICILLTGLNFACIYIFGCFAGEGQLPDWVGLFMILILMMHVLANRAYYLLGQIRKAMLSLILAAMLAVATLIGMISLMEPLGNAVAIVVAAVIALIQMIYSQWYNDETAGAVTHLYTGLLCLCIFSFNLDQFGFPMGISLVVLILLLRDALMKRDLMRTAEGLILQVDALFLVAYRPSGVGDHIWAYTLLALVQMLAAGTLLTRQWLRRDRAGAVLLKVSGVVSISMIAFFVKANAIQHMLKAGYLDSVEWSLGYIFGFAALVIVLVLFYASGYFYDWTDSRFKWFARRSTLAPDKSIAVFYWITTIAYLVGIGLLYSVETAWAQICVSLCVLAVALLQSARLIQAKKYGYFTGIWIGAKYLALIWAILNSALELSFDSVIYSVAGLGLALLCIAVGFRFAMKSLRFYGLILTILMALKFIAVDLNRENSIVRVIALMLGGGICFGISILYNKLNLMERDRGAEAAASK